MKFNKIFFSLSAWIVIVSTYVLPSHNYGEFKTLFGYPLAYLTIYDNALSRTLLSSFNLNIGILLIDIFIIYFIICRVQKLRNNKRKNTIVGEEY